MSMQNILVVSAESVTGYRYDKIKDAEYLVVPAVAVKGGIVWQPVGSLGPTLVPSDVLANSVESFNDIPVVLDHPDGLQTAKDVSVLKQQSLGRVYNARMVGDDLVLDVWIKNTNDNLTLTTSILKGKKIEVSIGAAVSCSESNGINANGDAYSYVTEFMLGDHLAISTGWTGACSVDAGCGINQLAAKADTPAGMLIDSLRIPIILAREQLSRAQAKYNDELSSNELRWEIYHALEPIVPGLESVLDVYANQQVAFFSTYTSSQGEAIYKVDYSLNDDVITVSENFPDDYERREFTYTPFMAKELHMDAKVTSGDNRNRNDDNRNRNDNDHDYHDDKLRAGLIAKITACETSNLTAMDLNGLPTNALEVILKSQSISCNFVAKDSDEYQQLLVLSKEAKARREADRVDMITKIKAGSKLSDSFLEGQSNEQLVELLAGLPDAQAVQVPVLPVDNLTQSKSLLDRALEN